MSTDDTKTDYKKFATETMLEMTKQLLTIASGFLVVSVALLKILWPQESGEIEYFWVVIIAWVCIVVSIASGLFVFGSVATSAHDRSEFNVDDGYTNLFLKIQQVAFFIAFGSFATFSGLNISSESKVESDSKPNDANIVHIDMCSSNKVKELLESSLEQRNKQIIMEIKKHNIQTDEHLNRHLDIVVKRMKQLYSSGSEKSRP